MALPIKKSLICAEVYSYTLDAGRVGQYAPRAGDVALFEVVSLGKHTAIQDVGHRHVHIFPNDRVLAAFGARYATSQFEGYVPAVPGERLHLLGQGGVVGLLKSAHRSMPKPTVLKLLGYAVDESGRIVNTKYHAREETYFSGTVPPGAAVILSLGSSMDSGKTTTAGYLARGLKLAGHRVAYVKLTGTAYAKDADFVRDCGADLTTDFSRVGFPSTYLCDEAELLDLYQGLLDEAASIRPDFVIVEIADGLFQRETDLLLQSDRFRATVSSVLFSCADSLSAVTGVRHLAALGLTPIALSGRFTMSPLLMEEVRAACDVAPATLEDILAPEFAHAVAGRAARLTLARA